MKDSVDSTNRKLIRPSLTDVKDQITQKRQQPQPQAREREREREQPHQQQSQPKQQKRTTPPEQTHAENFYYLKQMQNRTPMVLVLKDGEELRGYIEWYDRSCLKVNREGAPNLLIYKDSIKYLYKESEGVAHTERSGSSGRGKPNGAPRN